jgi:hypothetical protein
MQGAVTRITLAFVLLGMLRPSRPAAQDPTTGAPPQDVRTLTPGAAIERDLSPGQEHAYRLIAHAGDFVRITIAKYGVNVVADFAGPGGAKTLHVNSEPDLFRPEVVVSIADADGPYTLIVRSPQSKRPGAHYTIVLDDLRPATPDDDVRIAWSRACGKSTTSPQRSS